ncbi:MAG: Uridylate kinase [Syntrophorhabdus sp. PtaB.Bin184]|jgi:uridylate kinase|nr:MAG: Uridylate kinase [Syntrophorhabdus sp. PtaB.Bin184]
MRYKRILLKLSGEVLMGNEGHGIDHATVADIAGQIGDVHRLGVQVGIVLGGGNIYRGKKGEKEGMDRVTGDYVGMVATVINALVLKDTLVRMGTPAVVQTALALERIAEPYDHALARQYLDEGKIVVFACGTGNPYFTTDTAAALRAVETKADVLMKATKVNGVYDRDPEVHADAVFYPEISYSEVLEKDLQVMDLTAITLCKENDIPVAVFSIRVRDNLKKVVLGERIGTIVRR